MGRLDLLPELFAPLLIPPAVNRELLAKPAAISQELAQFIEGIEIRDPDNIRLVQAISADLGEGEAEAIALATEMPDTYLVMDDSEGRRLARRLGLPVIGLLGLLLKAKSDKIITAIKPILERLIAEGFWLSEDLQRQVLDAASE